MSNKKAEEYRKRAQESRTREQESWERSDTDGFVSQWAHGISARLYDTKAAVEEAGGQAWFTVLTVEETGEIVPARGVDTQFGLSWVVDDPEWISRLGRKWIPTDESQCSPDTFKHDGVGRKPSRSRVQKSLGLIQAKAQFPAYADTASNGTGLSGNVWIEIRQSEWEVGCKRGSVVAHEDDRIIE